MRYWISVIFIVLIIPGCFRACATADKMVDNGFKTVYDQFKPEELLRKYEWFKNASSSLDAKIHDLQIYESRFGETKAQYGVDSMHRAKWTRDDREQWNIWQSEYIGLKASYNDLAAEYNAAMVKFNYRFCNVGDLPQGATEVLPREYRSYISN